MKIVNKPLLFFTFCTPMVLHADEEERFNAYLNIEQQASADISGSSSSFKQKRIQINLDKELYLDDMNTMSVGLGLERIDITSNALLPGSNAKIPNEVKGGRINLSWSHEFESGKEFNLSGALGSLSDKPFKGSDSLSKELEASLLMPTDAGNAWIVGMGASDDGGLNDLPSLAFQWNKSERFQALIGLPFVEVNWQPFEQVELTAILADKESELSTSYNFNDDTAISLSHGKGGWTGRRFARSDKKSFMNYEETRTALTLSQNFGPAVFGLSGGVITDRSLSENKDGSTSNSDLNIKDAHFIALNFGMEF